MLSSFVAGPLAWGGIGWLLDAWLGTGPWLLASGVVLGFVLGAYLVVKRSEAAHTPRQRRSPLLSNSRRDPGAAAEGDRR